MEPASTIVAAWQVSRLRSMTANDRLHPETGSAGQQADDTDYPGGVLGAKYRWVSIGMCALILLSAFEALAIETVMPTISRELGGSALYALAFSGPLGMGVVGMVIAGNWSDRGNPRTALYSAIGVFAAGLLIAGTAQTMWIFVVGRLIHGLGGGAVIVALYVIVARVYPPVLHARIFAGFAAAWVIPSLVGPLVAGLVTQQFGWRWVYLGVIVLLAVVVCLVVPSLRSLGNDHAAPHREAWNLARIGYAVLVALAVMGLNLAPQTGGALLWLIPVAATAVVLFAIKPLVPAKTLTAGFGLPSVILLRGLVSGAFVATEVYIPYLLSRQYGLSPVFAGLALSAAGVLWAAASWVQGRFARSLSNSRSIWIGTLLLAFAVASCFATAAFVLPPWVIVVGWAFAGSGMGLVYPRLTVATLEDSTMENQGFNSSALSISDSTGAAFALAITAIASSSLMTFGGAWPIAGCFLVTTLIAVAGVMVARRVTP